MINGIQNTKGNDYQVAAKMAKTHSKEQLEQMYEKSTAGKRLRSGRPRSRSRRKLKKYNQ